MSKDIREIAELIKTQDNRMTDQPLFLVQEQVTDYGFDSDYSDDYVWINHEYDCNIACDRLSEILDRRDDMCRSTFGYEKVYVQKRWEFVTACFTEKGCQNYLNINGHNLGKTRIYAHGSYRNNEYQTVRKFLLDQRQESVW